MTKLTSKMITNELQDGAWAYVCGAKNATHAVDFYVQWEEEDEDAYVHFDWDDMVEIPVEAHKPYALTCRYIDLETREWEDETLFNFMTLQQVQGYMKRYTSWAMPRNSHNAVTFDNWQVQ